MNLKKIIKDTQAKVEKTVKEYNDPQKKQEREIKRALLAMQAAEKGSIAYGNAKKAFNDVKKAAKSKVEEAKPVAEQVLKTGKEHVARAVKGLKK